MAEVNLEIETIFQSWIDNSPGESKLKTDNYAVWY